MSETLLNDKSINELLVDPKCWYHGVLDRTQTENLIKSSYVKHPDRNYLVRRSPRPDMSDSFALSVIAIDRQFYHFPIKLKFGSLEIMDNSFDDMRKLLTYFTDNILDSKSGLILTCPIPPDKPQLAAYQAIISHVKDFEDELSFTKGEEFSDANNLANKPDQLYVMSLKTLLPGFVSTKALTKVFPDFINHLPYFHEINTEKIESLFASLHDGFYLLRPSESLIGSYVLQYRHEGILKKFIISPQYTSKDNEINCEQWLTFKVANNIFNNIDDIIKGVEFCTNPITKEILNQFQKQEEFSNDAEFLYEQANSIKSVLSLSSQLVDVCESIYLIKSSFGNRINFKPLPFEVHATNLFFEMTPKRSINSEGTNNKKSRIDLKNCCYYQIHDSLFEKSNTSIIITTTPSGQFDLYYFYLRDPLNKESSSAGLSPTQSHSLTPLNSVELDQKILANALTQSLDSNDRNFFTDTNSLALSASCDSKYLHSKKMNFQEFQNSNEATLSSPLNAANLANGSCLNNTNNEIIISLINCSRSSFKLNDLMAKYCSNADIFPLRRKIINIDSIEFTAPELKLKPNSWHCCYISFVSNRGFFIDFAKTSEQQPIQSCGDRRRVKWDVNFTFSHIAHDLISIRFSCIRDRKFRNPVIFERKIDDIRRPWDAKKNDDLKFKEFRLNVQMACTEYFLHDLNDLKPLSEALLCYDGSEALFYCSLPTSRLPELLVDLERRYKRTLIFIEELLILQHDNYPNDTNFLRADNLISSILTCYLRFFCVGWVRLCFSKLIEYIYNISDSIYFYNNQTQITQNSHSSGLKPKSSVVNSSQLTLPLSAHNNPLIPIKDALKSDSNAAHNSIHHKTCNFGDGTDSIFNNNNNVKFDRSTSDKYSAHYLSDISSPMCSNQNHELVNQQILLQQVIEGICENFDMVPLELRKICTLINKIFQNSSSADQDESTNSVLTKILPSIVFLRFICPPLAAAQNQTLNVLWTYASKRKDLVKFCRASVHETDESVIAKLRSCCSSQIISAFPWELYGNNLKDVSSFLVKHENLKNSPQLQEFLRKLVQPLTDEEENRLKNQNQIDYDELWTNGRFRRTIGELKQILFSNINEISCQKIVKILRRLHDIEIGGV